MRIERHEERVLIWGSNGTPPVTLNHDELIEVAQRLLDYAGAMRQEKEEEEVLL